MSKRWKITGINFDHFHMGDLLRMAHNHPDAEIAAVCDPDPARMLEAQRNFSLRSDQIFTDVTDCLNQSKPDIIILCPAAARHAEWVEMVAPWGIPVMVEKPFAATVAEADRMVAAMAASGAPLAINWPICWVPAHATARRLVSEGLIGQLHEVHYYGGNRGPLYHGADKTEKEPSTADKAASWFYKASEGGGSLLDYLCYGATLATWYLDHAIPEEVTCVTTASPGLEVDEHSITVARYPFGLCRFETRWGTFTDPWVHQPQPKCGFVLKGSDGTIASYDYETSVHVQTRSHPEGFEVPADSLAFPHRNPVEYLIHCLSTGTPIEGPLSPAISRTGQRIVDTAFLSAQQKRTLPLVD
jgi:glucose-fructose oxidoreductase